MLLLLDRWWFKQCNCFISPRESVHRITNFRGRNVFKRKKKKKDRRKKRENRGVNVGGEFKEGSFQTVRGQAECIDTWSFFILALGKLLETLLKTISYRIVGEMRVQWVESEEVKTSSLDYL